MAVIDSPERLKSTGPGAPSLELDHDLAVIKVEVGARPVAAAEAILQDGAVTYAVVPRAAKAVSRHRDAGGWVGPVYRAGREGPMAVPTGRVTVPLAPGADADSVVKHLTERGFRTIRRSQSLILAESPQKDVSETLGAIAALGDLPGAESATPQLLFPRAFK